jgi:clan AA aspartic protease
MITGTVNVQREAIIRLTVLGPGGQQQEIDAVVDTGFNGFLTLPPALIDALGCIFNSQGFAEFADGRIEEVDIYETTIDWDGQERHIEVDAADTDPLVGMALMYGYKLTVEDIDGGVVTIERLTFP